MAVLDATNLFRSAASTPARTFAFCYVAMRRAGLLRAQED